MCEIIGWENSNGTAKTMKRKKNGSPFVKEMKTDMKKEEGKTLFVCACVSY